MTAYDNIALALSVLRVFGGEVNNFMLSFCPHAFVVTVVSFGIIYLLSMVLNVCIISGVKLIDLLNAERKNEELKKRNNVIYAIAFAVGLVALAGGALSLRTDELFPGRKQLACGFTLIAFATVCIFYSVSSVVLMLVKSNRKFYYRDINSFLVRQLGSRMQGNFLSMSAVCLLLTLTMVLVTAGVSIAITMSVALLAVQQLTEVNDNQKRYRILEKQGVPDAMMRGTIRKQVGVYFLAPFVLAFLFLLSSIGVVTGKASDFCNMDVGFHVVPVMIIVLIVYGGYYLATVWSCQRMVLGKK